MPKSRDSIAVGVTVAIIAVSWYKIIQLYRENQSLKRSICHDEHQQGNVASTDAGVVEENKGTTPCNREHDDICHGDRHFFMEEIGFIQSPFPQRAGCPRQGTLAPHVRSHLVLHSHTSREVLDGITAYSHLWIIFAFHLNPRGKAKGGAPTTHKKFTATKIRPPRANGEKVGVMATRAPHRPNPVGLSLGLLEQVITRKVQGRTQICLVLQGLDLVDGTPVYDIKPYVPWDRIEHVATATDQVQFSAQDRMKYLKVPPWVSSEDELATVSWNESAIDNIRMAQQALSPFYAQSETGIDEACRAIGEIIAQDPRALRDGRGSLSQDSFEFTFGLLRVSFRVTNGQQGKMAEVIRVEVDHGDITAANGSYPHNLALRRLADTEAAKVGKKLDWEKPVREGTTQGLFDLKGGGIWKLETLSK